ncbi:urea carboxylase-associated family protein [Paenibacillus athensensis]|uniref:Urea carboxylase n=1 Tax=Paenibacillus athensensis TaxID=1967502 RepID=A0A4Y8PY10_9BACL|nr:urea amidolyase associated protein UAAP1 [Paenibacillus athensensis]MCD1259360.1 urea carboxylase-associated family protein [Paenibacillus athensensis]
MENGWTSTLTPGGKWSGQIGRGRLVRFTALEAGANVSLLLYSSHDRSERYNMPDTLKAQHTAHLTRGHVLMSDNGRVLASIVEDSLGWHDPLGGCTTREGTEAKYGATDFQRQRNDWLRSGRENVTVELVRHGLSQRDWMPVVNLFSKICCDEQGAMRFIEDHCPAGASVTLRTEMDALLVVSNTPHPLDPRPAYPSVPVRLEVLPADKTADDDYCVHFRPENRRAFENTWNYYTLLGSDRT